MRISPDEVRGRIVLWGPAESGKTAFVTSLLRKLSAEPLEPDPNGEAEQIGMGEIHGRRVVFEVVEVRSQLPSGQKLLRLKGVDVVIFVADSRLQSIEANMASLDEARESVAQLVTNPPADVRFVFLYNKSDLADALPVSELDAMLNADGAASFSGVTPTGVGVTDAMKEAARLAILSLKTSP